VKRLTVLLAACQPPSAGAPTSRPAPPAQQFTLFDLAGSWRWLHRSSDAGTSLVEDETWRLVTDPETPTRLVGRYLRAVEVHSLDRVPFQCDQAPWYRQRALFEVTAESASGGGFVIHETAYATEPSPCDHGFRHTGDYRVEPGNGRLVLRWDGGSQTLWQVDDPHGPLAGAPWPETYDPAGPWRWDATTYDPDGSIRDEHEWWEITHRGDSRLDATYRRRVTIRSADGKDLSCAGAPSWSFDDAYVLDGQREEEHWHFHELAVEPGDHPCLRTTPHRTLDEATAEQIGDYLVLEWRGKRKQILYRPVR
jgi:hypothetical protein